MDGGAEERMSCTGPALAVDCGVGVGTGGGPMGVAVGNGVAYGAPPGSTGTMGRADGEGDGLEGGRGEGGGVAWATWSRSRAAQLCPLSSAIIRADCGSSNVVCADAAFGKATITAKPMRTLPKKASKHASAR